MTVTELLKSPTANIRLSYGDVWLYWDKDLDYWVVRQHIYRKRLPNTIIKTESESEAVATFCKAAGIENDTV